MPDPTSTLDRLRRGDLAGARELRLHGLREFPAEVFGLADSLEVLDLGGGALTALPDDLPRLSRLRVLFCSGNRFERLPPALGGCAALSQIGFRANGLREVPGEALPPRLRWLTLTDNRIDSLPEELGRRPLLQKLMLAGNRLRHLPASLAGAPRLELIRLSANLLDTLPGWLPEHPTLAWAAWAGNPGEPPAGLSPAPTVTWDEVSVGALLGEGASGRVHEALWRPGGQEPGRPVALKLFKGAMTSDGLPEREMAACLAAGRHPHLTGSLGRLAEGPDGTAALLMPRVPDGWRVLAGPPSAESCSRDVYDPALRVDLTVAWRLARAAAAAVAHLHGRGIGHGDLYAHNILWDGQAGEAVLGDFGAASILPRGSLGSALGRIEVRAWGLLLGELLDRASSAAEDGAALRGLERACTGPDNGARPSMAEVVLSLEGLRPPE